MVFAMECSSLPGHSPLSSPGWGGKFAVMFIRSLFSESLPKTSTFGSRQVPPVRVTSTWPVGPSIVDGAPHPSVEVSSHMRTGLRALLLLLVFPDLVWSQTPVPQPTPWPQGRTAAISLTFDDGMQTHLDNAGPVLKKHELQGTFYVITGPSSTWRTRPDDWHRLAAEGNEIASHTVNHPCLFERIEIHSQDYTAEMMLKEIRDSSRDITERLGIRRGLTFAFPCGNMTFGPPAEQARNQAVYLQDVADFYFAARSYNSSEPVDAEGLNPLTVPDLGSTTGKDFAGLLTMIQATVRNREWGIFTFHGVGGEWLSVSTEALDELAGYLQRHKEIWTAPFGDVVRYIQESKALGIEPAESADRQYQFSLNWPLDPKVFDLPLTLKWELPSGWETCKSKADGQPLECTVVVESDHKVALIDVPPRTRMVQFEPE